MSRTTSRSTAEKRAAFRALHADGCFVLPNPWDVGSARLLQHLGFAALASTSSGHAWTMGHPDYTVTRDDVLQHLSTLCGAVDLPVNADFESGFAAAPEDVATNVGLAVQTGVAGLSI
jgi:2-methylisocitrate lyase-like PEP mutase family enzyme